MFSQEGIFSRAEKATDKYGQAKARETLELALGEAQMQKYEQGLTDEQLDNQIGKVGELLPKEKPDHPELQNVIVDGYIFEIDRSVPKIVDYIGPADGIIITAYVSGNDGWVKPDEKVTVKGSIKIYGGGTITSSSAVATNGVTIPTDFPTAGGSFTIPDISVDTDISITARDSEGNEPVSKKVEVRIKRDGTAPTVETLTAKTEGLTIKFTATGHDRNAEGQEESGIDYFNYTITSIEDPRLSGVPADKRTGTFTQEQTVEITATYDYEYTITVTATDNSNNTTPNLEAKTAKVFEGITITEAKEKINTTTYPDYIGTKLKYQPTDGVIWRVFYYAVDNYFGDGEGTIYLRRDKGIFSSGGGSGYVIPDTAVARMKSLNPKWRDSQTLCANEIDLDSEKRVAWLCDSSQWTDYVTADAKYAVGSPSLEMWLRVYDTYLDKYAPDSKRVSCDVPNARGYGVYKGSSGFTKTKHNLDQNIIASRALSPSAVDVMVLCSPSEGFYVSEYGCCMSSVDDTYLGYTTTGGNPKAYPLICLKK